MVAEQIVESTSKVEQNDIPTCITSRWQGVHKSCWNLSWRTEAGEKFAYFGWKRTNSNRKPSRCRESSLGMWKIYAWVCELGEISKYEGWNVTVYHRCGSISFSSVQSSDIKACVNVVNNQFVGFRFVGKVMKVIWLPLFPSQSRIKIIFIYIRQSRDTTLECSLIFNYYLILLPRQRCTGDSTCSPPVELYLRSQIVPLVLCALYRRGIV